MRIAGRTPSHVSRKKPIAACLAAAFALGAPLATATNRFVSNCADSGAGSLRDTVASALDTDTVDLSALIAPGCSTITLTTGAIMVEVNNLTLTAGNGAINAVTIDGGLNGGHHNRVITHTLAGLLKVEGLVLTDAKYSSTSISEGGCIFSSGSVELTASTVSHCSVFDTSVTLTHASGGGITAAGSVTLLASTVTDNTVQTTSAYHAAGGGVYSFGGDVTAIYSTIANNKAVAGGVQNAFGGGIETSGNLNVSYSTISGNQAEVGGGVYLKATGGSHTAVISSSTISGNSSSDNFIGTGGVYVNVPLTLSNSTIAFNTTNSSNGGGLFAASAQIQSSIIADNTSGGAPSDLSAGAAATGANNLIFHSSVAVPPGTLVGVCPRLLALADNGGGILTHALRDSSPAIDKGNNAGNWTYDERGLGYPRVHAGQADIGAYEWQGGLADRIFNTNFEPGCDE